MSILSRRPSGADKQFAEELVRGSDDNPDYTDLIWALLNTHEFMFVQ